MKKILILLVIGLSFGQSACERDDICAESTPTTPLLIIRFIDAETDVDFEAPTNLAITIAGEAEPFTIVNNDSIAIPLRTNEDMTSFRFTINSAEEDEDPQNTDELIFSYVREEEYVSKACGFRVVYEDLQNQLIPGDDGNWIDDIEIVNPTIVDDTSVHIRIFH